MSKKVKVALLVFLVIMIVIIIRPLLGIKWPDDQFVVGRELDYGLVWYGREG